ncbi:MAG: RNA polymerase sigma factor RpoE [Gammaproteobacteria bacterium]|nr:RNA polymerase sigma factor RpoE [Gammaproteobacteria bacterium]
MVEVALAIDSKSRAEADRLLVERVKGGDRAAFNALVLKYQRRIVKLVSRYIRDPEEALDVSQEVFIRAYKAIDGFRGDSAFYTWLYRIAVNAAKNAIGAATRNPVEGGVDVDDPELSEIQLKMTDVSSPERLIYTDELKRTINAAIDDLPPELRRAIILRELEGLSYEEIAQAMKCPVGTVRSRIFRARDAITRRIEPLLE